MRPELSQAAELLRSSDPKAVDEAIRLLQGTVFSFSMKVCGHREDAEDTMQEVLVKAIPYLAKIESPQALAVWLYKVARNRCWMSRRRSKFAPTETLTLDELMPDADELESLTADAQPDPEAAVLSGESAELLHAAILRLPPQYRLIVVLHDMEDLDSAEVAKITALKPGTVRVRLHRARLLLRRELAHGRRPPAPSAAGGKARRAAKPIQCREMFAQLSEYLDGLMPEIACERIQKHLEDCPPCVAFVADLERAVQRCRAFTSPCKPETADRLRQVLVAEYLRLAKSAAGASM
jgi:RNA polymerase sigma-70 factor (ECF subfamily)